LGLYRKIKYPYFTRVPYFMCKGDKEEGIGGKYYIALAGVTDESGLHLMKLTSENSIA